MLPQRSNTPTKHRNQFITQTEQFISDNVLVDNVAVGKCNTVGNE